MNKPSKRKKSNLRPVIKITADQLSITALFVDALILLSIWIAP